MSSNGHLISTGAVLRWFSCARLSVDLARSELHATFRVLLFPRGIMGECGSAHTRARAGASSSAAHPLAAVGVATARCRGFVHSIAIASRRRRRRSDAATIHSDSCSSVFRVAILPLWAQQGATRIERHTLHHRSCACALPPIAPRACRSHSRASTRAPAHARIICVGRRRRNCVRLNSLWEFVRLKLLRGKLSGARACRGPTRLPASAQKCPRDRC